MIIKIAKIVFKVLFTLILGSFILYFSFLSWEYITGGKYVEYLKNNIETTSLDKTFSYKMIDKDIEKNKLILVGEIHGFKEPEKIDFNFFKHLNSKFNIKNYIAEFDFVQSIYLNRFLKTGNKEFLNKALKNWGVIQGRNNQDYYTKYLNFYNYNKNLPDNKKFRFIGVDNIHDLELTISYLNEILKSKGFSLIKLNSKDNYSEIKNSIKKLVSINNEPENSFTLNHILKNILFLENKISREKVLFENFKDIYNHYSFRNEKIYGYFGLFHIFQYKVNNYDYLASYIRKSNLGLKNKIVSISYLFVDCKMVVESSALPSFMRQSEKYSRVPVSYDNIVFMYLYGIRDFKRVTNKYSKSIIKLNGENSPYKKLNSNRLRKAYKLLSTAGNLEFNEKGKEYVQYNIFIRNSDWAEPMK